MKRHLCYPCAIIITCMVLCAQPLFSRDAVPEFSGWKQTSTRYFRFIYEEAYSAEVRALTAKADTYWNLIGQRYSRAPDRTDVIISGRTVLPEAFAEGIHRYIHISVTPPLDPDFSYREHWLDLLFIHEMIHLAHFNMPSNTQALSKVFGPLMHVFPIAGLPGWAVEGTATLLETELTSGGRGRSPLFEMSYKALALENSFIGFEDIGTEKEPPNGQIYVMGYLIMKSIVDRYGFEALAAIEAKRTEGLDYASAVRETTGQGPDEIYRDAKIALTRKYAPERMIPEGLIISSRATGTSYRQFFFTADNTVTALRERKGDSTAAIRWNIESGEEEVLFEGHFSESRALAVNASKIYASLVTRLHNRSPGSRYESDIYRFTPDQGLVALTRGADLIQPALSADGSRLVATELRGSTSRLVEIDQSTGSLRVLLEKNGLSFLQPSLSPDGKSIVFLVFDGKRSAIATAPMPKYDFAYPIPETNIQSIYNAQGPVMDVVYPRWSANGTILFASNERGRLELWEYANGTARPVLSDPVGVLEAEKRPQGIVYRTVAGSGQVLKIKPLEEWGKVPASMGPSAPGTILGAASQPDYPLFTPFTAAVENDFKRPVFTPGFPITDSTAESAFFNAPRFTFWMPLFDLLVAPNDSMTAGIGAMAVFTGYPLQHGSRQNMVAAGAIAYPADGQCAGFLIADIPLGAYRFIGAGIQGYGKEPFDPVMKETGSIRLSLAKTLSSRHFFRNISETAIIAGVDAWTTRSSAERFSLNSDLERAQAISLSAGVEHLNERHSHKGVSTILEIDGRLRFISFPALSSKTFAAPELVIGFSSGTARVMTQLIFKSRWYDFPENAPEPVTLVRTAGWYDSGERPGQSIIRGAVFFPSEVPVRLYVEKTISYGALSEIETDPWWYSGIELEARNRRSVLAGGLVTRARANERWDVLQDTRFYLSLKFDSIEAFIP